MKSKLGFAVLFLSVISPAFAGKKCPDVSDQATGVTVQYLGNVNAAAEISNPDARYSITNRSDRALEFSAWSSEATPTIYTPDTVIQTPVSDKEWADAREPIIEHYRGPNHIVRVGSGETVEFMAPGKANAEATYRLGVRSKKKCWIYSQPFSFEVAKKAD